MRRRLSRAALLALALVLLLPDPAWAYFDKGRDGKEGAYVDVRSSTRTVWTASDGRRYLRVGIRTWNDLGPFGSYTFVRIRVRLDARGGKRADARMAIVVGDAASGHPAYCAVRGHEGRLFWSDHRIACRVRTRWVRPTKRIRWKLTTEPYYEYDPQPESDAAPDAGWYP